MAGLIRFDENHSRGITLILRAQLCNLPRRILVTTEAFDVFSSSKWNLL